MEMAWSTPIFTAFVRENRFTRSCLDKNPEFTVNVPLGDFNKKILGIARSESGRNIDKIAELGLHLEKPETITVPGIQEFPLTLECRLLYKQLQDKDAVPDELKKQFIPRIWMISSLWLTEIIISRIMVKSSPHILLNRNNKLIWRDSQCGSFLRHKESLHVCLFQLEKRYFLLDPARVACEAAVGSHDTVAGHDDGDAIV